MPAASINVRQDGAWKAGTAVNGFVRSGGAWVPLAGAAAATPVVAPMNGGNITVPAPGGTIQATCRSYGASWGRTDSAISFPAVTGDVVNYTPGNTGSGFVKLNGATLIEVNGYLAQTAPPGTTVYTPATAIWINRSWNPWYAELIYPPAGLRADDADVIESIPRPPDVLLSDSGWWRDQANVDPVLGYDRMVADADAWEDQAAIEVTGAPLEPDDTVTTVVYEVHRITTAWGNAIEAEVLRGYDVVGQLALRIFDPWDGAIPFADAGDGRLIATVTGVGSPNPLYGWEYGIWVEGIALDRQVFTGVGPEGWLATRLIVDGAALAGGSVPSAVDSPPA